MVDIEEHQEDLYSTFDDDDEYNDNYFDEVYEKNYWVLVLGFECIFSCLYIIIQMLFIR